MIQTLEEWRVILTGPDVTLTWSVKKTWFQVIIQKKTRNQNITVTGEFLVSRQKISWCPSLNYTIMDICIKCFSIVWSEGDRLFLNNECEKSHFFNYLLTLPLPSKPKASYNSDWYLRTGVYSIEGGCGETDVCSRSCLLHLLLVPCSTMASNKLRRILLLCLGITTFILGTVLLHYTILWQILQNYMRGEEGSFVLYENFQSSFLWEDPLWNSSN